jgi:hypothetical protein
MFAVLMLAWKPQWHHTPVSRYYINIFWTWPLYSSESLLTYLVTTTEAGDGRESRVDKVPKTAWPYRLRHTISEGSPARLPTITWKLVSIALPSLTAAIPESAPPFVLASTMANDTFLTDDFVAELMAREAKDASIKYSTMGLEAFRSSK